LCSTLIRELNFANNFTHKQTLNYLSSSFANLDKFFAGLKNEEPELFNKLTQKINQLIDVGKPSFSMVGIQLIYKCSIEVDVTEVRTALVALSKFSSSPQAFFANCQKFTALVKDKNLKDSELGRFIKQAFGTYFKTPADSSVNFLAGTIMYYGELANEVRKGDSVSLSILLGGNYLLNLLYNNQARGFDEKVLGAKLFSCVNHFVDLKKLNFDDFPPIPYSSFLLTCLPATFAPQDLWCLSNRYVTIDQYYHKQILLTEAFEKNANVLSYKKSSLDTIGRKSRDSETSIFDYVREYREGDSTKSINHKATAKHGKVYSNVYRKVSKNEERSCLIVDANELLSTLNSAIKQNSIETLNKFAKAVLQQASKENSIYLATNYSLEKLALNGNFKDTAV
jgi:Protein of unknown function DUF58